MTKTKAIIIDDEAKVRKVLELKLEKYCPEVEVVGDASDIDSGYEKIIQMQPALVFLDISMPNGSGFDLLDRFQDITFEIIFVTGFNDYILDALRVSAVDYLLKPVQTEDLQNAVQKALQKIADRKKIADYDVLKHNIDHLGKQSSKIVIPGAKEYSFVSVSDVLHCEGWQKYTRIHLSDGTCLVSSYNIGVFRELLESYDFMSVHKSHLINMQQINSYHKSGTLVLSNGAEVPVARRKREDFLDRLKR
jgi:two-component system LytT family response regulator